MSIWNALKGVGNTIKNPKVVAPVLGGTTAGLLVGNVVDNATTTASPDVVINSQVPNPTGTPSNATDNTLEWVMATMLLNGSGGFNGSAGMGGNNTDNPRLDNPTVSAGIPIIPIIIVGVAIVAAIFIFTHKKGKKRGRK